MKNLTKLLILCIFVISSNVKATSIECIMGSDMLSKSGLSLESSSMYSENNDGSDYMLREAGFFLHDAGMFLRECFEDIDQMSIGNPIAVTDNTNNINTNSNNITANSALIATNTSNIALNAASIAANSSLILTGIEIVNANQQNISANALNIETLFTNIDSLTSSVNSINQALVNQSTMLSKGIASSIAISNVDYSSDGWEFGFGRGEFNSQHEHAFGLSYGSDKASFKVAYNRESTSVGFKVKLGN